MTQILVGNSAHPNYNVQNAGPDRTFTVTTTIATTGISSAGLFPAQAVGFGGFTIALNGVEYTVAYVTSTSAAILSSPYAGAGGATTCVWYKWVWMQIYSDSSFQPFGESTVVSKGTPGTSAYYKKYACSLVNSAGINYLRHPQVSISSTTDSPGPTSQARYFFGLYLVDGRVLVQSFPLLEAARVPPTTPTSLNALATFNQLPQYPQGNWPDFYTADEIDSRFPPGLAGQIYGFQQTGNNLAAFTLGAGFLIDLLAKTINVNGTSSPPVRTITFADSPAALTANDGVILINCAAGPVTLAFPPAATLGVKLFYVIKIDGSVNAGTLDPNGAETINGAATFPLNTQYASAIVYCTGSTFYVFGGGGGSAGGSTRLITASTTLLSTDGTILCDTTAADIIITLPDPATVLYTPFTVQKIDTSRHIVSLRPPGYIGPDNRTPQAIGGDYNSWILGYPGESVTFRSVGLKTRPQPTWVVQFPAL